MALGFITSAISSFATGIATGVVKLIGNCGRWIAEKVGDRFVRGGKTKKDIAKEESVNALVEAGTACNEAAVEILDAQTARQLKACEDALPDAVTLAGKINQDAGFCYNNGGSGVLKHIVEAGIAPYKPIDTLQLSMT